MADSDTIVWWPALCGHETEYDAFWSPNISTYTSRPDVTRCYQDTVLTWVPVGLLWVTLCAYTPLLKRRANVNGWAAKSWLHWTKLVVSLALLAVDAAIAGFTISHHDNVSTIIASILQLITMFLIVVLTHYEYKKGLQTSIVLSVYLMVAMVTAVIRARSSWIQREVLGLEMAFDEESSLVTSVAALTILLWLLNVPSDMRALSRDQVTDEDETAPILRKTHASGQSKSTALNSPEEHCSFWNRVIFGWCTKFIHKGNTSYLKFEDVYDLLPDHTCEALVPRFQTLWDKAYREYSKSLSKRPASSYADMIRLQSQSSRLTEPDIPQHGLDGDYSAFEVKPPSLIRVLCKSLGHLCILSNVTRAMQLIVCFLNPIILSKLLDFLETDTPYMWKGFGLAVTLGIVDFIHTTVVNHALHYAFVFGIQVRSVLTAAIYRKVLRLSSAGKKATTTGQIINLISVDAQRIQDSPVFMPNLFLIPFMILISMVLLWQIVGPSSLVGLGILLLVIIPINGVYLGNWIKKLQVSQMIYKDSRLKLIGEILSGIKVLKLYAWEKSFLKKVYDIRQDELDYMKKANYLSAASSIAWNCTTYIVSFLTFAVYVTVTPDAVLDAKKVFVTTSIISVLNTSLYFMPMAVSYLGQGWVALNRIRDFLLLEELPPDTSPPSVPTDAVLSIQKGTLSWDLDSKPTLKGINLHVGRGQLVAVVGKVGSGKSSLVSALLGEMWKLTGTVHCQGNLAYVPQQAWIQNKTVRDNILFGKTYYGRRYREVVAACAMETDFKILMDGDRTEIGEKGINLSGGQKQRISLARAVYQDSEVYLLDDPLSAVDAHVGKHLFEKVIGNQGMLKKKTRLFVTHGLTYLPHVDNILVMDNGRVVDSGPYSELVKRDGAFAEFLRHINDDEENNVQETTGDIETSLSGSYHVRSLKQSIRRTTSRRSAFSHRRKASSVASLDSRHMSAVKAQQLIAEEVAQEGNLKLSVIKDYVVAGGMGALALTIVSHVLYGLALIFGNLWLSKWTDDSENLVGNVTVVSREQNMYRLSVYGGIIAVQVITSLFGSLGIAIGSVNASRILHNIVVERLLRAPMRFFDTTPLGRIMNRLSRDMDMLDFNVPMQCRQWFFTFVPLVTTVIIVSLVTPMFLAVAAVIGIIFGLIMRAYVNTVRQLRRIDSIRRSPLFAHFDESVGGATSIRAYQKTEEFIQKSDALTDDSQKSWYMVLAGQRWLASFLQFLGTVIVSMSAAFAITQADTSSGEAGMSISFSLTIFISLTFYVRAVAELETYMVSAERIQEYTTIDMEAPWDNESTKPPSNWPSEGNIEFDDYSTRYRPGLDLVLKGISCNIRRGEKVGVVGRTGAGKSSIALSLFRIVEAAGGQIKIDGLEVAKLGLHDLRGRLTVIPQDPVIFSGSLRLNLDPLDQHTDAEISRALQLAHLGEYVQGSAQGLEYECGENGEALSIGQRQLVCLARALLRQTQILVLDEATAAIDLETDELIQTTIRTAFKDCTILTIAHRINTILDYDRVIVMDAGKIVEFDTPTHLLDNTESVFHGMAKSAGLV